MQMRASVETTSLQFQSKCVAVVFSTAYNWGARHLATELVKIEIINTFHIYVLPLRGGS